MRSRRGAYRHIGVAAVCSGATLLQRPLHLCLKGFVGLFLLFLLQGVDNAVDSRQTVFLRHLCQLLQRVLQVDGLGVWHQLVEHLRATCQFLVVGTVLVEQSDGLAVAALGVGIALHIPVQTAKTQQQHAFLNARTGSFRGTILVGADGVRRVLLQQVYIAHSVVHLVEVVLVVVVAGHAFQPANHTPAVVRSHHLCLGNAGVELQLVGRILADNVPVGFIGLLAVAEPCLYLSHQEPFAGFLHAAPFMLDDLIQIGYGMF